MNPFLTCLSLLSLLVLLPQCHPEGHCYSIVFPRGTWRAEGPEPVNEYFTTATMVVSDDEVVFTLHMTDGTTQVGTYRIARECGGGDSGC